MPKNKKGLVNQVIPFKSPLTKGDSGGCVFLGYFTTPVLPLYPIRVKLRNGKTGKPSLTVLQ